MSHPLDLGGILKLKEEGRSNLDRSPTRGCPSL